MKTTHGLIIVDNRMKVLCVHPTNQPMDCWSLPKGGADKGETSLEAATRELYEETGLKIDKYRKEMMYYEYLGSFPYKKQKKRLKAHVMFFDHSLSKSEKDLKCQSMVDGADFLECDMVEWKSISFCLKRLHPSQIDALGSILQKIATLAKKFA